MQPENIGKLQSLIIKNPTAFVAAFFAMLFLTLFGFILNATKTEKDDCDVQLKIKDEQIDRERAKYDALTYRLLERNNIIEKQNEVIKKADSTLKENVSETLQKLKK